jgi:hypothetical protein
MTKCYKQTASLNLNILSFYNISFFDFFLLIDQFLRYLYKYWYFLTRRYSQNAEYTKHNKKLI